MPYDSQCRDIRYDRIYILRSYIIIPTIPGLVDRIIDISAAYTNRTKLSIPGTIYI